MVKRDRFSQKAALFWVWWNSEGVKHFELVPNCRATGTDLYCGQLDEIYAALTEKYPALVNRKLVLLTWTIQNASLYDSPLYFHLYAD